MFLCNGELLLKFPVPSPSVSPPNKPVLDHLAERLGSGYVTSLSFLAPAHFVAVFSVVPDLSSYFGNYNSVRSKTTKIKPEL